MVINNSKNTNKREIEQCVKITNLVTQLNVHFLQQPPVLLFETLFDMLRFKCTFILFLSEIDDISFNFLFRCEVLLVIPVV